MRHIGVKLKGKNTTLKYLCKVLGNLMSFSELLYASLDGYIKVHSFRILLRRMET